MLFRINAVKKTVSPTLDTSAYASADTLFVTNTISGAVADVGGVSELVSLVVKDDANQKQAIDLLFFDEAPANSFGAANAAYALVDADLPKLLGRISVGTSDYVSSSTNSAEATIRNLGLLLKAKASSTSLFVVGVCRSGTPTYAASSLTIDLHLKQY